ncbi:ATP-binding cassette domain-containing protein [Brevibacterium sp. 5221]|uniref:ATP-binding cassette domain-containing protein n=1 Tax=Brevibacterium rongguiense TaxID=2695267 RepID=A0A6N9H7U1_9MICO|nr:MULTISPECIES: ATP-binding cassette domain-containing protein [Brevibacterium]MYM20029.1 ATP-binding cassette domain-containing protein [Brevibacterium rongguiense]WAL41232.1 ATP-binding cassette domain-containing protein [Brevibacterium sp. BRM-1]
MDHRPLVTRAITVPGRLAPVSFALGRGAAVALRGTNGSGKTTALEAVAGLRRTRGEVLVCGAPPDRRSARFRAQVAAQLGEPVLDTGLTVLEHAITVSRTWGRPASHAREACESVLDELGIAGLRRRLPHEMSSGQRQLFVLALTLVRPATLLVLDEPERRLARSAILTVATALRARMATGTAVLVATHSEALVAALGSAEVPVSAERA